MFHRSDSVFLVAAFVSFVFSVYLWFTGPRDEGMFVGMFVTCLCTFGLWFTIVEIRRISSRTPER